MASQHNSLLDPVPAAARHEIEAALEEILRSIPFRTSRQCQDLFRYIVEHSLAGLEDSLRERVIGIEVFGRAPDYDTSEDPVVRLRASDVRKRLAQYYQAQSNGAGSWKVEIPTGSYKAHFHPVDIPGPQAQAVPRLAAPRSDLLDSTEVAKAIPNVRTRQHSRIWLAALLAVCLVMMLAGAMQLRNASGAVSSFDQFWAPVLENSRRVLVCTGSNRVYILSEDARDRYRKSHPRADDTSPNLEILVPKGELENFSGHDFVPVKDTFLTVGDASATAQIASLFSTRQHAFDLRFGNDLSFGDLRQGSAVLIGAFNNSWTLDMTDNLRFVFEAGDTPEMHVRDRIDPSRAWSPKMVDGKVSEDYAIVSRVLNSKTGAVLVTIAGLNHSGTRAAGDFATSPQLINDFMKRVPKDWSRKNLQLVLHTDVVNDIPRSPTVVATYYW